MKAADIHKDTDRAVAYFNPRENYFLLVAEAPRGYGSVEINKTIKISDAEFDSAIASELLTILASFQHNAASNVLVRSGKDYQLFRKKHLSVGIERQKSSGDVRLWPRHRIQGGFGGRNAEQIVLSVKEYPTSIAQRLRDAFATSS